MAGRPQLAPGPGRLSTVDDTVLLGFLKVLGISLVPVAVVGGALHARAAWEHARAGLRRVGLARPAAPPPAGPPLERLAADLRRLRPQVRHPALGVPMAKHRGTVAAYDERLVATATALGVPTVLAQLPVHDLQHEAERLRLEAALEDAGIRW